MKELPDYRHKGLHAHSKYLKMTLGSTHKATNLGHLYQSYCLINQENLSHVALRFILTHSSLSPGNITMQINNQTKLRQLTTRSILLY